MAFDADKGFLLNGKPYVLKGTCNHQDHAGVGAALPDRLQYFRIARLKEMGCNAYRTSHNPPTPELLEACDRLGMLVMDENRLLGSDAANLRPARRPGPPRPQPSERRRLVHRQRGSRVQTTPPGGRVAATMQTLVQRLDPTRPVTYAANVGNDFAGINGVIDVRGWNYHIGDGRWTPTTRRIPAQPNVGTEQASTVCTRGIYANDPARGYVSAYDDNAPAWAQHGRDVVELLRRAALALRRLRLDRLRLPRRADALRLAVHQLALRHPRHLRLPQGQLLVLPGLVDRPARWSHLLPHWNWPGKEGQEIDVRCFSNCEEVELFLNGQSLGKQTMPRNSHLRLEGEIRARHALGQGLSTPARSWPKTKVETTGAPAAIQLTPDRADDQCRRRGRERHHGGRHRRPGPRRAGGRAT